MPRKATRNDKKLVPLGYTRDGKQIWCELCKRQLAVGQLVGWWRVRGYGGRLRWAVYCRDCHWANVREGEPLR
jgi:hypothetical protein